MKVKQFIIDIFHEYIEEFNQITNNTITPVVSNSYKDYDIAIILLKGKELINDEAFAMFPHEVNYTQKQFVAFNEEIIEELYNNKSYFRYLIKHELSHCFGQCHPFKQDVLFDGKDLHINNEYDQGHIQ